MKKIIILITLALFHVSVMLAQGFVMSLSKVLNHDATVLAFNSSESARITGILASGRVCFTSLRRYALSLLLLLFAVAVKGQEWHEFHVETPGTLQEVMGEGAEELTHVRVTGTINDKDIKYLHYLAWSVPPKSVDMDDDTYLKMVLRKEDSFRVKLQYLDLEDARMVNDALSDEAFHGSYIIGYKLPQTLKKIGDNAFEWNVLLKELIIPESVDSIGIHLLRYSIEVEKVRLPDNLKVLNEDMFAECWELKDVNIPSQVKEIYDGLFHNCHKLPASAGVLPETVEILDGLLYYDNMSIQEMVVPKNVRVLRGAFKHMIKLRKVTILTDKLTEIGNEAFAWCNELEEVNIPEGITRIGNNAFWWDPCLRKVDLPSTLTRIESFAFDSDPLDSIDIPAGVTWIGHNAFWNNRNLKKVYTRPVIPPSTHDSIQPPYYLPFHFCSTETAILYVPKGSADAYRASVVFSEFQNIVELDEWQWPTSINRPASPSVSFKVYGEDGVLRIVAEGNKPVAVNVYGIDGTSVWRGWLTDRVEIPLPKGFYVVQAGKSIQKVSL